MATWTAGRSDGGSVSDPTAAFFCCLSVSVSVTLLSVSCHVLSAVKSRLRHAVEKHVGPASHGMLVHKAAPMIVNADDSHPDSECACFSLCHPEEVPPYLYYSYAHCVLTLLLMHHDTRRTRHANLARCGAGRKI